MERWMITFLRVPNRTKAAARKTLFVVRSLDAPLILFVLGSLEPEEAERHTFPATRKKGPSANSAEALENANVRAPSAFLFRFRGSGTLHPRTAPRSRSFTRSRRRAQCTNHYSRKDSVRDR
ncbi:hypothetical protein MRX96_041767 [Rhipicephalus microplus]